MNLNNNENVAICGISNVFSISIVINDNGETLKYQYNDGNYNKPKETLIKYTFNENGGIEPYFETEEGMVYYLSEFIKNI